MIELLVLFVVVALVGGLGVLLGLRFAPRIERWTEEREESNDDAG